MSVTAIALILIAAIAHASWNLFSKQAATVGTTSFIWLVSVAATVSYAPAAVAVLIVQRPHLTALNWAFMAGTGILQAAYFLFLQNGYRVGDLSLVYPIGRGTGALLAALAGIVLLGERPGPAGLTGIMLIVAGVVVLGIPARATTRAGVACARAGAGHESGPRPELVRARVRPPPPVRRACAPLRAAPAGGPHPPRPRRPRTRPARSRRARPGRRPDGRARRPAAMAIMFAGLTGLFIASYTLWDKHAVTTLHTPPLLQGYAAFPIMSLAFAPLALRDRPRLDPGLAELPAAGAGRGDPDAAVLHPGAGRAELHRGQRGRPRPRGERPVRGAAGQATARRGQSRAPSGRRGGDRGRHHRDRPRLTPGQNRWVTRYGPGHASGPAPGWFSGPDLQVPGPTQPDGSALRWSWDRISA